MKKIYLLGFLPLLSFGWGESYYSIYKNGNGMAYMMPNIYVEGDNYRVSYASSQFGDWLQKDNFMLYVPNGAKSYRMSITINGSYKSIDAFISMGNIPNDDIKSSSVVSKVDTSGDYQRDNGEFKLLEEGKTLYTVGAVNLSLNTGNLNIENLNKWIMVKTSNRYYCDSSISRRELLRASLTPDYSSGSSVSSYSSYSSSSSSIVSTNECIIPGDPGCGGGGDYAYESSSSSYSQAQESCNPESYDAGVTWSIGVEYIFDKAYVDNQVGSSVNSYCKQVALDANLTSSNTTEFMCSYLRNLSASSAEGVSGVGYNLVSYVGDPKLEFKPNDVAVSSSSVSYSSISSSSSSSSIAAGAGCDTTALSNVASAGWHLLGAAQSGCSVSGLKNAGADIVWVYRNGEWLNTDNTTIDTWDGFWIYKK